MPKSTNENKTMIQNKLEYIGLNLSRIPKFLTEYTPLNYRAVKSYDDNIYKVYKHINVQDIEILLTPTDRLADLRERYKLAAPLFTYLDEKSEENIEKFTIFLNMLKNLDVDKIEELEEEQKLLKENIPTEVKYKNNFIWQIYYSDYAKKFFMLVPINEQDTSALFYVLKKQINSKKARKKETIFVPISNLEYSGEFLTGAEITDIENYLWFFTKEWASIYEVYDLKDKLMLKIVGNTNVYEKIKSDYVVTLKSKQEAIEFYKLLKAMFILATGIPNEYKFDTKIDVFGKLQFEYNGIELQYEKLSEFIKDEYNSKIDELKETSKEKDKLEKRLKRFNSIVDELTQEYLIRQKQIATFLECKKTFFGKVKYFFKKKKNIQIVNKIEKSDRLEKKEEDKEIQSLYEEKEQYTIEDLINLCTKLDEKKNENSNLNLDINAIESKKDMLSTKIDNADLYIKEIDKHKKSIFEFWKFTSKDEIQTLNQGQETDQEQKEKISKSFDYETDIDELGKTVDETQRRKLSKNETDAIFAAKVVTDSIKKLAESKQKDQNIDEKEIEKINSVLEKDLNRLKEEYKNNIEYINIKDFDIFGGLSDDKTKIKTINNEKHRETQKDKYKVLNINLETDISVYRDNLQHYVGLIMEAFNKIKSPYNMPVYIISAKKKIAGINVFNMNPQETIYSELKSKKENLILCKVNIKENMPIIYYSNIIFYDNFNKTLPLGMNLSSDVLVNLDKMNLSYVKEEEFNINYEVDQFTTKTKRVKVYEYDTKYIM